MLILTIFGGNEARQREESEFGGSGAAGGAEGSKTQENGPRKDSGQCQKSSSKCNIFFIQTSKCQEMTYDTWGGLGLRAFDPLPPRLLGANMETQIQQKS